MPHCTWNLTPLAIFTYFAQSRATPMALHWTRVIGNSQKRVTSLPCKMQKWRNFKTRSLTLVDWSSKLIWAWKVLDFKAGPPLEAISVIFGPRALIFFCLKALGKNKKWHHFCAHAQWWSPWMRKNVEKGHLAPSNLTFLLNAIDTNGFRGMKEEGLIYKTLPQIFYFCLGT